MEKERQKDFRRFPSLTPPRELYNNILLRVETERIREAKMRLAAFGMAALTSFIALFPAFQYAARGFYQSGSYEYLSLIFSDGTALLPFWKEFLFTVAESFPIFETAVVLAVIWALIESAKMAVRNTLIAFRPSANY